MTAEENKLIEDLFGQYGESLWRYALVCLEDESAADELISDLFHAALEKPEKLVNHEAPFGWLITTLKNKIKKYKVVRSRDVNRFLALSEETLGRAAATGPRPTEEQAERNMETGEEIQAKIKALLSPKEQYIFRRVAVNKATHKEIAAELGITVWDSQKKLERIRKKLSKEFPDYPRKKKK